MSEGCAEEVHQLKVQLAEVQHKIEQTEEQNTRLLQDAARTETEAADKHKQMEDIQQKNYSLNLRLSSTEQTLQSCSAEMDALHTQLDQQTDLQAKQLADQQHRHTDTLNAKLQAADERCNTAEKEAITAVEQLQESKQQLLEARESINRAAALSVTHDDADLLQQVAILQCEKQELEAALARATTDNVAASSQICKLQISLQELGQQLEEKECRITSYYNEVQRLKEDLLEHEQELEMYRMNEKDLKGKGNSLFAEVEDHRLYLQKQFLKLQSHYKIVTEQYQLKVQNVSRLKTQVATLMSLGSRQDDGEYVRHLNESLRVAQNNNIALKEQINEMAERIRIQIERPIVIECLPSGCRSRSSYYINTFRVIQRELSETVNTLKTTRFDNLLTAERMLEAQRRLNTSERNTKRAKAEIIRLTVQLQDIEAEKGIFTPVENCNLMRTEKLPDFEAEAKKKEEEEAKEFERLASQEKTDKNNGEGNNIVKKLKALKPLPGCRIERIKKDGTTEFVNYTETEKDSELNAKASTSNDLLNKDKSSEVEESSKTINIEEAADTSSKLTDATAEKSSPSQSNEETCSSSSSFKRKHCIEDTETKKSIKRSPSTLEDEVFSENKENDDNNHTSAPSLLTSTNPTTSSPSILSNGNVDGNEKSVGDDIVGRKIKKSVRLLETVDIQDSDGGRSAEALKTTDSKTDKQMIRRPMKRMQVAAPKQTLPEGITDCNNQ